MQPTSPVEEAGKSDGSLPLPLHLTLEVPEVEAEMAQSVRPLKTKQQSQGVGIRIGFVTEAADNQDSQTAEKVGLCQELLQSFAMCRQGV